MNLDDQKVQDILAKQDYLAKEELEKAVTLAKKNNLTLVDYLLTNHLITKSLLGQALAESQKVTHLDFAVNPPAAKFVHILPEEVAKKYHVLVVGGNQQSVIFATPNPTDPEMITALKKLFPTQTFTFNFTFPEDVKNILIKYKKPLATRFAEVIKAQTRVAPEIIEEILSDAFSFHASDIHFEPNDQEVVIRFRIDGVLHEAGRIPIQYYENILNRIKVQSHLRIDEHFAVQDGSIEINKDGDAYDTRVSIVPVVDGEKVVMRLLSEYIRTYALEDLGLDEGQQEKLTKAIKKPFGMILVTGPTGSGKTTTLYAIVKKLNSTDVNITTIEDPVEYKIAGVNHIQVAPEKQITFAEGLRSIVRQDPDIILVGEIRDHETADIATNAALTGHLLFSTFHSNDASTAIPRLLDMGVEPFLVASTVELVIAQRLVRKICEACRYSHSVSQKELLKTYPSLKSYFTQTSVTLYKGKGCKSCGNTGYKGRIGLFEMIEVTPAMQSIITKNPSTAEIWTLAEKEGSISLFEDGIAKVKKGTTTIDEVLRVANAPHN